MLALCKDIAEDAGSQNGRLCYQGQRLGKPWQPACQLKAC